MMLASGILTVLSFVSAILFPWPLTAALAIAVAFIDPLVPIALGLFMDTLYSAGGWPQGTISGAGLAFVALVVRRWVRTSTMW